MNSKKKKIETTKAPKAIGPYSQAILTEQLLFVSGQLPIDPETGKLVESEIRIQTQRVLQNLEEVLKAAGCHFENVVRCDVFLKEMGDFAAFNEIYGKKFNGEHPPARQTIQVAKLPLDALIEISCIAIVSK